MVKKITTGKPKKFVRISVGEDLSGTGSINLVGAILKERRMQLVPPVKKWQMAEMVGVSVSHYIYLETQDVRKIRVPSDELIKKLAECLTTRKEEAEALQVQLLAAKLKQTTKAEVLEYLQGEKPSKGEVLVVRPEFRKLLEKHLSLWRRGMLKHIEKVLGITEAGLMKVVKGEADLSAAQVGGLARLAGESPNQWLLLAGYVPPSLRELWLGSKTSVFADVLDEMSPPALEEFMKAVEGLAKLYPRKKRTSG